MDVLNRVEFAYGSLDEAFPPIDPHFRPFGSRVLVQLRSPKSLSKGGVWLPTDAKDTEFWAVQVAKVRAIGPNAFKDRRTNVYWPEGPWCEVGDFIRVPKFGGDRFTVPVPKGEAVTASGIHMPEDRHEALFVTFNDTDLLGQIDGDPLVMKTYI